MNEYMDAKKISLPNIELGGMELTPETPPDHAYTTKELID